MLWSIEILPLDLMVAWYPREGLECCERNFSKSMPGGASAGPGPNVRESKTVRF